MGVRSCTMMACPVPAPAGCAPQTWPAGHPWAQASGSPARTPHCHHLGVLVIRGQSAHLCGPVPAVHRDRRSRAFLAAVGGGQQAFRVDANSCHHPRVAVRQLQHFGCIPGVGGLFTHAHHAPCRAGCPAGNRGLRQKRGHCSARGCQKWGRSFALLFGGGLVHQPDANTHEHQRRQILPAEQGFALSTALSSTLTTGFTKPKMAMRLTGLFFISRAHST